MCLVTLGASVASALWFPGFVECLKVENVHSPGKGCADAGLEKFFLVDSASMCIAVIGTT